MKKVNLLLPALLVKITLLAQPFEGKIVFDVTYPDLPTEMKQIESMLPKEMTMYINPNFTRIEQASAIMGNTVIITDNKSKTTTMLMDMMGNKIGVKSTKEDIKKRDGNTEYKIEETEETKEIAGYRCKKAIISFSDGGETEMSFDVYYTTDIESPYLSLGNMAMSGIKGFPLEYSMKQQNMLTHYKAKSIKREKVSKSLSQIPAEYKIMSQDDFQKQMGGNIVVIGN